MRGALLAVVLTGAVVSGCGSGQFASPLQDESQTPTEMRQPSAPSTGMSAAEVARAVNLRKSDFPYLSDVEAAKRSPEDRQSDREFEHCVGPDAPSDGLAESQSPKFSGGFGEYLEFSSSVEVFPGEAEAEQAVGAVRSRRAFSCFKRLLVPATEAGVAGAEVELVKLRTSRLRSPAPGLDESFAYRVTATVAPRPESDQFTAYHPGSTPDGRPLFDVYLDVLGFSSDRVAILLTATGAPRPVPRGLERNVLELLDQRARTEAQQLR